MKPYSHAGSNLGFLIRQARLNSGLSRQELEQKFNLHPLDLCRLEQGILNPNIDLFLSLMSFSGPHACQQTLEALHETQKNLLKSFPQRLR